MAGLSQMLNKPLLSGGELEEYLQVKVSEFQFPLCKRAMHTGSTQHICVHSVVFSHSQIPQGKA